MDSNSGRNDVDEYLEDTTRSGKQVSLKELFFLSTVVAGAFGMYIYISPALSRLLAAFLVLYASIRWSGLLSPVLGGILGFCVAMCLSFLMCFLAELDELTVLLFMIFPAFGYVTGYVVILNQNDPFI